MKQCIYCGAELRDDARACNNCGRPVPDMPEPEREIAKTVTTEELSAEKTAAPPSDQPVQVPQEPWEQPPQNPWGQPTQSPWGEPTQNPQSPWEQQNSQSSWGQQNRQDHADPWSQQGQQGPWNPQSPQQGPWGWQQNGPVPQNFGGPYPGYNNSQNVQGRFNTFALWAFILGFLSSFLNGFVFIPSILAIVFGIVALMQIRKDPLRHRGTWMAIVGMILAIFFLIVYAQIFRMVFQAVQDPETFEQLQQYLREIGALK